jgi:hypothetical protein
MTDQPAEAAPTVWPPIPDVPRVAVKEPMKPVILPVEPTAKQASVLVSPVGFQITNIQPYVDQWEKAQPAPQRRKGTYIAADLKSLLAWMTAHCPTSAPVFAVGAEAIATNWRKPALALAGIGNYSDGVTAAWHDFIGVYRFPVTSAWAQWAAGSGEWMDQVQFSEFVERHLWEITAAQPDEMVGDTVTGRMVAALGGVANVATPAQMYSLSNGVKIMVSAEVEVELDRATGEQKLRYSETHTGKGGHPVGVPKFFFISIPIFFGEEPSLVGVLLRYRNLGGGKVGWCYELFAPDLVVKEAFDVACTVVTAASRTLYMGTPDRPNITSDALNLHY